MRTIEGTLHVSRSLGNPDPTSVMLSRSPSLIGHDEGRDVVNTPQQIITTREPMDSGGESPPQSPQEPAAQGYQNLLSLPTDTLHPLGLLAEASLETYKTNDEHHAIMSPWPSDDTEPSVRQAINSLSHRQTGSGAKFGTLRIEAERLEEIVKEWFKAEQELPPQSKNVLSAQEQHNDGQPIPPLPLLESHKPAPLRLGTHSEQQPGLSSPVANLRHVASLPRMDGGQHPPMNVGGVSEGEEPQVGEKADETEHPEGDQPSGEPEAVFEPQDELAIPRMSGASTIGYLPERLDEQLQFGVNLELASGKTTSP